jgi:ubiquinone/menaquinone biosynthesis C-methylase UbiE
MEHAAVPVAAYYNRAAETWDNVHGVGRQSPFFTRQLRENLRTLLAQADCNAVALELGAGTGPYIDVTAPLFARLVATDLSEGMLAVFSRRLAELGISNVTLVRQDACDLSAIDTASFDVVYSVGLLQTVPDLARLFAETYRVLRPGGLVAGISSNGDCPWYSIRNRIERGNSHCRTGQFATSRSLAPLLHRTGFADLEMTYWGAVPATLRNPIAIALLSHMEALALKSPVRRYLGVLGFRAYKHGTQSRGRS